MCATTSDPEVQLQISIWTEQRWFTRREVVQSTDNLVFSWQPSASFEWSPYIIFCEPKSHHIWLSLCLSVSCWFLCVLPPLAWRPFTSVIDTWKLISESQSSTTEPSTWASVIQLHSLLGWTLQVVGFLVRPTICGPIKNPLKSWSQTPPHHPDSQDPKSLGSLQLFKV